MVRASPAPGGAGAFDAHRNIRPPLFSRSKELALNTHVRSSSQLVVAEDTVSDAIIIPEPEVQSGMSLAQILAMVLAHWKMSVLIAVAVVVAAGVATKLMPKTYLGVATLMVNNMANDPLAVQNAAGLLGPYVSTQVELLQSSEVLDTVIERLNLTKDPEFAAGNRGGDATLRDWVESKLRKSLDIEPGRFGAQLIYITAAASNSVQAADIANAVADVFTEQQDSRTNGPSSERGTRYAAELAELKRKVTLAQNAADQFRNRSGTIDLDAKVDVEMDTLTGLEHRLQEARNTLRTNQAQGTGNQSVSAPVMASATVRALHEEDARLRAHMAQLRANLGPNHPQVVELQSQIDANNRSLAAAMATYSSAASSEMVVSGNEVASLERAVAEQRQKVLEGRRNRDEGAKYQLELESAQAAYKRALDGYDQIMFVHSTNITVAGRARPPLKADKPNAIKNLLLGAFLGLGLGIVLPFGFELLNRRVRCRDDLERDFGIPILTEFQAVRAASAA
jgi:uncharacterized protein involved in exopolysaccharide biosynthesis